MMTEHVDRDPTSNPWNWAEDDVDPALTKRLAELSDEELMDLANEVVDEFAGAAQGKVSDGIGRTTYADPHIVPANEQ